MSGGALLPGPIPSTLVSVISPRYTVAAGKRLSATSVTREQPGGYRTRCASRLVARITGTHNQSAEHMPVIAGKTGDRFEQSGTDPRKSQEPATYVSIWRFLWGSRVRSARVRRASALAARARAVEWSSPVGGTARGACTAARVSPAHPNSGSRAVRGAQIVTMMVERRTHDRIRAREAIAFRRFESTRAFESSLRAVASAGFRVSTRRAS